MSHQRPSRNTGDAELGFSEATENHLKSVAAHPRPPAWLVEWEAKRPVWLTEMLAEAVGVFIYVYLGVSATASLSVTTAAKISGFGSLLTIGFSYGFGIAFAILVAAPLSGSHLSPGYTVAFTLYRGFPVHKAARYIFAQLLGGFIACLVVYGSFGGDLQAVASTYKAAREDAAIFTSQGPAGVFALFPNENQPLGRAFCNEFFVDVFLAIVVFTALDTSNSFVTPALAPFIIGLAYSTAVWGFVAESIALNTARDLGGRCVATVFFGRQAFTAHKRYTALAALTNIAASTIGGGFHLLFLSNSGRLEVATPPVKQQDGRNCTYQSDIAGFEGKQESSHLD